MNQAFIEYFRCSASVNIFRRANTPSSVNDAGYFKFGHDLICFGSSTTATCNCVTDELSDAVTDLQIEDGNCILTFDPSEVVQNLRSERYIIRSKPSVLIRLVRKIYYALRPLLTVSLRRHLQKAWLKGAHQRTFPKWPVDLTVDQMFESLMLLALQTTGRERIPFIWFWPESKSSCAIMTHDVETATGLEFTPQLMDLNDSFNIKSSFQLIPAARYTIRQETVAAMRDRGFEVNIHDLRHDGHLFDSYEKFSDAAKQINIFRALYKSEGFRAGALYRNQAWYVKLKFSYDMSVPNVAHLDPQHGGCCTVMPYFVGNLLELPVTTTQDYTLFQILETYSQDLWKEQVRLIMEQHGLISFIVHPDYLDTDQAREAYTNLMDYLAGQRANGLWITLPGEVDRWWRQRSEMELIEDENGCHIKGLGADRAVVAYAYIKNGKVVYDF